MLCNASLTDESDNNSQKDENLVLAMEQADRTVDNIGNVFTFVLHSNTSLQPGSGADGTDATAPSLVEFINIQAGNIFWHLAARKLDKPEQNSSSTEKKSSFDERQSMESYRSSCSCHYQGESSPWLTIHHYSSIRDCVACAHSATEKSRA